MRISAPCALDGTHDLADFRCVSHQLERWLTVRAIKNKNMGATTCFVVCDEAGKVVGYYALAAGSVSRVVAPGYLRRNMPDPIPVAVLGRLAVHTDWMGQGIGRGLLKDAMMRTLQVAEQIGIRALVCHAIDENAKAFYLKHAFMESPLDPLTLLIGIEGIRGALS